MSDTIRQIEANEAIETPYDASDPKQVNNARKKSSKKLADRLRVVEALMQHPEGRRWIYEMLQWCHIYGNPVVSNDTHGTYFNLGQENVGKRLLADVVTAAPDNYLKMIEENK